MGRTTLNRASRRMRFATAHPDIVPPPPKAEEETERPLSDREAEIALEHAVKQRIRELNDHAK